MSRRLLTLLTALSISLVFASVALAQPQPATTPQRSISGTVVDADSSKPLVGAEVSAGEQRATADGTGRFMLRVAAAEVAVTALAAGHFPLTTTIDARTGDVSGVEFALARDAGFETSVSVVGTPPAVAPAAETIEPMQVLRTPGALDNIYRTLQTLPGVAAADEFGSRLSARGGSPDQNLTIMDGVEVHDPYRLFGLTSAFNPETIQRFELATGGFGVKYGDRLSSLLVVENRDGRPGNGLDGSASLNITDANVVLEGGLPTGVKGSWLVTGRRTYYDLVAERLTDQEFPAFQDLQARLAWAPSGGMRLTMFSLTSRQAAALDIDNDTARGEFQDDTDNDLAWLRIDTSLGAPIQSHTILGYSDTRSRFGVEAAFQNTSQRSNAPDDDSIDTANVVFERALGVKDYSLRQEFAVAIGAHLIDAGFEAHRLSTSQQFEVTGDRNPAAANGSSVQGGAGLPDFFASSQRTTRTGAWIQDRWQAKDAVSFEGGLRLDRYPFTGETRLSPRVSGVFAPSPGTRVTAGIGLYRQGPGYEKSAQSDYVLDFTSVDPKTLRSERAWQSAIGVERTMGRGLSAKMEVYYKRFTDVLLGRLEPDAARLARIGRYDFPGAFAPSIPTAPLITTVPGNDGRGRAYGLDLFVNRPGSGRLTGWASYTLGKAERAAYGRVYPFEYDRRHAFAMVSSFALTPHWEVAATTRIASGFPRTAPIGVRVAGREDTRDLDGDGITDEILPARDRRGLIEYTVDLGGVDNINNARLPIFARVDSRLTWRPRGAAGRWEIYAEVINVLNRKNAGALDPQLAYDATSDRPNIVEVRDQAIPRLPTVGVRFRF